MAMSLSAPLDQPFLQQVALLEFHNSQFQEQQLVQT
jgi:hypothetical protein